MGIVPVACGGTTRNPGDDDDSAGTAGKGRGGDTSVGAGATGGGSTPTPTGGTVSMGGNAGSEQGGMGAVGGTRFVCENPQLDPTSGLVRCDKNGYTHRPKALACDNAAGQPAIGGAGGEGPLDPHDLPRASGAVQCTSPGDCAQFQWGYCGGGGGEIPYCRSGCEVDGDCGAGQICICGSSRSPTAGECVTATCATDSDCPGSICATHNSLTGCGQDPFRCVTQSDTCVSNQDCAADTGCVWNPAKQALECAPAAGACGRPFLVADEARLPPVVARNDWSDSVNPRTDHLTRSERAALAQHWTHLGQMEHASIAAFARFSLQLLSLGAPSDLVEACTQALADETAHAKLCFGIASAYAGRAIGPGPLDVAGSLDVSSLADIVDLVILEGCIGETTATLDALEAAQAAADPVICDAYLRIAADEQRHAELAFRFVQWAVATGGEAIEARVASALEMLPNGAASEQVVRPCLSALCRDTTRAPCAAPQPRLSAASSAERA